jgi:predicted nucleic acid-binding protein
VRELIDDLWNEITRIDVTEALVQRAGDLCDRHGLRAYDAVHLASCESIGQDDVVLVAADGDLLVAAREHGVTTLPLRG